MIYKSRQFTDKQKKIIKEKDPAQVLARRVDAERKVFEIWITRILPRLKEKYKVTTEDDMILTIDCGSKTFFYDYKKRMIGRYFAGQLVERKLEVYQFFEKFIKNDV